MTIEELEEKLKIRKNTCIYCPTTKLAKQVFKIFHQLNINWYSYEENTLYYPFEGEFYALEFAPPTNYKIINAKDFIALHTEGEEFDLENYEPKGELEGFPKEIIAHMLNYQEEQCNPRDVSVFEKRRDAGRDSKGFSWYKTKEGDYFWHKIINNKNFNPFFEKYPKQDSQKFRIGDEVINIITGRRGKITQISTNNIYVNFNEDGYTVDGRYYISDKYPRLLHYRDDYDYSIIDFNNLPKRQEPKRWRAEKGRLYYFINFNKD